MCALRIQFLFSFSSECFAKIRSMLIVVVSHSFNSVGLTGDDKSRLVVQSLLPPEMNYNAIRMED